MKVLADKLLAMLRRDLLLSLRYGRGLWLLSITLLLEIAGFAFLAKAIGPGFRPEGIDYFPFLVAGTGLFGYFVACMNAVVSEVRESQVSGALEVLLASGTQPTTYWGLSSLSTVLRELLQLLVYLGIGFVLASRALIEVNWTAAIMVLALSITMAVGLCLLAAAAQVVVQKGGAFVWFFGSVAWLFAGATFSVDSLPAGLRGIAHYFPLRYALDTMRGTLLKGSSWSDLLHPMGWFALGALTVLLAGAGGFSFSVRHAQRRGTLSFY
jgi:ABC-type polysaccharide/polyol phosphate export permease